MAILSNDKILSLINFAINNRTESTDIEFKDARGGIPGDLWRTISSFSHNPKGGMIVFGVNENRNTGIVDIVGGLDLALLQEKIVSYLREEMINHGEYDLKIVEYENKSLLVLIIEPTTDERKPCYKKQLGLPNGACVRQGNTDRVITDEEMKTFIRNSAVYKFDKTQAKGTSIEQLSQKKIEDFLKRSAVRVSRLTVNNSATVDIMRNLGIVDDFNGKIYPTVAGFLIFSKDIPQIEKMFSRYVIRCVRYQGVSVTSQIIDKSDIDGTLDQQIELMHKFILRNISLKATISGTKRVEQYEYPDDAIRELIANAIIHRDYMITETYTQINIFSNRIEISNPGNLPPGVTIENIKEAQFSRNEIIAATLKDMDYLEEYGRGIDIVFSRMHESDLLEPIFKNTSNRFTVILLGEVFKKLNDRQIRIWYMLQDKKQITAKICRDVFPEVSRATINNDLAQLVDMNLIVPKGSASNTYYEPQY